MARGAAFFDLDKTLMEGSSAVHFGRAAYRAGLISKRQLLKDAWANVQFRLRGSTDATTQALWDRILQSIAGKRVVDLSRLAPQILSGVLPRLYPQMLDTAWAHQDAGRPVYIVTAASQELSELLATVLDFDGGIGVRSEVRDGVYTGRPDGPFTYREGKAEAIRQVAAENGLDLAESYAYSDSESDLPMLRTIGHPVVVNPDAELRSAAREQGWEVVQFDKLHRRLRIASVAAGAGLVAAGAGYAAARATRPQGLRARLGLA
jgi:HAD superfamily hydrolase (TIGR01490 family)